MSSLREATLLSIDNDDATLATVQYHEDGQDRNQQVSFRLDGTVGIQTLIGRTVYVEHGVAGQPVVLKTRRT